MQPSFHQIQVLENAKTLSRKTFTLFKNYWKFDELRIPAKVWTLQWTSGRSRPKKHADSKQRAVSLQQITYRQQKRAKKKSNASHSRWEEIGAKHVEHLKSNELIWTHFLFREHGLTWDFVVNVGLRCGTGQLDPSVGLLSFGRGDARSWRAPHQLWHLGCLEADSVFNLNNFN